MKLKLLALIAFFVIAPQIVSARNSNPSPTPMNVGQVINLRNKNLTTIQERLNVKIEEREEKALTREETKEQKREEIKAKLTEKRQERIANLYLRIGKRMESAIERLNILADRILARLAVLESEGEEVVDLQTEVDQAKALILSAEGLLGDLQGVVDDLLISDEPKAIYPTIKESVEGIKDTLKDSHSILVNVITQIKGLRVGESNLND